jgi:hypothetical protein
LPEGRERLRAAKNGCSLYGLQGCANVFTTSRMAVCGRPYIKNAAEASTIVVYRRPTAVLKSLTPGWVVYGKRRHAELPEEDVPPQLYPW